MVDYAKEIRIDSFFINVEAGDAAIHLLVEASPPTSIGVIQHAVLVDGGKDGYVEEDLKATILNIETLYSKGQLNGAHIQLRFDAIVVSHWDGDHFRGSMGVIAEDAAAQYREKKGKGVVESKYMKYDPQKAQGDPLRLQTVFYRPKTETNKSDMKYAFEDTDEETGFLKITGSFKHGDGMIEEEFTTNAICNVCTGTGCLGKDLFTGKGLAGTAKWDEIDTLEKLLSQSTALKPVAGVTQNGYPAFLCVGIDDSFLGLESTKTNVTLNESSLMCIIVWPKRLNQPKPRISLYTGGDAETLQESRLVAFLTGSSVECIKASHHGSERSTAVEIFGLSPGYFIMSAGDKHGHPTHSVLDRVFKYLNSPAQRGLGNPRIFATRYPYWLQMGKDSKIRTTDLNPSHLNSGNAKAAKQLKLKQKMAETSSKKDILQDDDDEDVDLQNLTAEEEKALLKAQRKVIKDTVPLWKAYGSPNTAPQPITVITGSTTKTHPSPRVQYIRLVATRKGDNDALDACCVHDDPNYTPIANRTRPDRQYGPKGVTVKTEELFDIPKKLEERLEREREKLEALGFLEKHVSKDRDPLLAQQKKDQLRLDKTKKVLSEYWGVFEELKSNDTENEMGREFETRTQKAARLKKEKKEKTDDRRDPELAKKKVKTEGKVQQFSNIVLHKSTMGTTMKMNALQSMRVEKDGVDSLQSWTVDYFKKIALEIKPGAPQFSNLCSADEKIAGLAWFIDTIYLHQLRFDGALADGDDVSLTRITLDVRAPVANLKDSSDPHTLFFTTDRKAHEVQFGKEIAETAASVAYYEKVGGLVFALEEVRGGPITVADLASLIDMPWPAWAKLLLSTVPLKAPGNSTSRSGVWFLPYRRGYTVLRLELDVDLPSGASLAIKDLISGYLDNLTISRMCVIGRKHCEGIDLGEQPSITTSSSMSFETTASWKLGENKSLDIKAIVCVHESGLDLIVQLKTRTNPIKALFKWLNEKLASGSSHKTDTFDESFILDLSRSLTDLAGAVPVSLRQIVLSLGEGGKSLQGVKVDFEIPLAFGVPNGSSAALFGSLKWQPGSLTFDGSLWTAFSVVYADVPRKLNPFREDFYELKPLDEKVLDHLQLRYLMPGGTIENWPEGIPDEVTEASIRVHMGSTTSISIFGEVQCGPHSTTSGIPEILLDTLSLFASYDFGKKSFSLEFRGVVKIYPPAYYITVRDAVTLTVRIAYTSEPSSWAIEAAAENLQFANLHSFFDLNSPGDAVIDMLGSIVIPKVSLLYKYEKSKPSALVMKGIMIVGPLELDLEYKHNGDVWSIVAQLKQTPSGLKEITLLEILSDLDDSITDVPEFIGQMAIPLDKLSVELYCGRAKGSADHVIFSLTISLDKIHFTYSQIHDHTKRSKSVVPKRLLRLSLAKLPNVPELPVVGELEQPFDQMDFLWVNKGLTRDEAEVLNVAVFTKKKDPLFYKDTVDPTKRLPTDIVVSVGCHFVIVAHMDGKPEAVIDHAFSAQPKATKQPNPNPKPDPGAPTKPEPTKPAPSNPPKVSNSGEKKASMAPMHKKTSSLAISNIGLKFHGHTLNIILDAVVHLGPVGMTLIGFSIDLDTSNVKKPIDLLNIKPSFSLSGMAVEFSRPPAVIAGFFETINTSECRGFAGGINISMAIYSFLAAGAYQEFATYKSMFVFAKLNGPLMEFGFAEVNGVTGGFGFGSELRFPAVSEVSKFPFVGISSGSVEPEVSPMAQLMSFTHGGPGGPPWMTPKDGSIWLAAGLGAKAFQTIEVQAVVAVELSSTPKLGIFGEAVAVMPKGAEPSKQLLVVDLGISITIDPSKGVFMAQGQLTPRSFLLHETCHITGGFALAFFSAGSGHDGDWVFTIGGYHPAYTPPPHYPVPPRLGISWHYDEHLSITGGAYFALTPEVVMAGARLEAIFTTSVIRASFVAFADFLINFSPFQFQGAVGVSISIHASVGKGFFSLSINRECSAEVHLHGPPLAGVVHVDLTVISFTVRFGPDKVTLPPVGLGDFIAMVMQLKSKEEIKSLPGHLLSANGLASHKKPAVDVKADAPWLVRAPLFTFDLSARVPIRTVTCNGAKPPELNEQWPVYGRPMELMESLKSDLVINIKHKDGLSPEFRLDRIVKNVPNTLWGRYNSSDDPSQGSRTLLSAPPAKLPQIMGFKITPRAPKPSDDALPPLNMELFACENVMDEIEHPPVAVPVAAPVFSVPTKAPEGKDLAAQLEQVAHAWSTPSAESRRAEVVGMFLELVDPGVSGGRNEDLITSKSAAVRPRRVYPDLPTKAPVGMLKEFGEWYPAAPRVLGYWSPITA
ncbi:hypothetical protein BU16DRAFT_579855 [Lophium mytilinum]|uniref:DUF6603 domain-containing protein n=1 Tax=Lophium mytilinum TaxID=390894 RepID=A0A6A6R276_9PEZI|nr:hypothetical protein BU16DRAFT_579855 [Lophium mytilinum]